MAKIEEYNDKAGKHRIRQIADNGEISDSTHQGYFNLNDAREGKINTSLNYLDYFMDEMRMSREQLKKLVELGKEASDTIELMEKE